MARVLKPGGRVGITDVALDPTRLDAELRSLAGWVSCLADARPVEQYVDMLTSAGLTVTHTESQDDALARMVEQIDARLVAFRMAKVPALVDVDFDLARERTAQAARAVRDGIAGYSLLMAEKVREAGTASADASASRTSATRAGTTDHHTQRPRFSPVISPASASTLVWWLTVG
jgi:arsenite methyltransferase